MIATIATMLLVFAFAQNVSSNKIVDQQGRLVQGVAEDFKTGETQTLYFVEGANGERTPWLGGVVRPDPNAQVTEAFTPQAAVGIKRLAVMLVNFTDGTTVPFSQTDVRDAVFNADRSDSLVARFNRNSYGQFNVAGDVIGPVTISPPKDSNGQPFTGCNKGFLAVEPARAALGISGYDLYMAIVPAEPDCPFTGYADIIGTHSVLIGLIGMRGGLHEVSHNLGRSHAGYLADYPTNPVIDLSACPNPSINTCEYGDGADPMGGGLENENAANKSGLGWLAGRDGNSARNVLAVE